MTVQFSDRMSNQAEHLQHQIEALVLSAMATVVAGSAAGKQACQSAAAGGESQLPGRLLQLSLLPEQGLATRLLALRLLEMLARDSLHGGATLRATVHHDIVQALRNDLKTASHFSADCVPAQVFSGLLDALSSVLLLPMESSASCVQTKTTRVERQTNAISRYQSMATPNKSVLSIPELVKWTYERYCTCPGILVSLSRFIGRVGCGNSFIYNEQWTVPCRKTFAVVLSPDVLDVAECCCSPSHPIEVRSPALSTLWFILHRSQRARSHFQHRLGDVNNPRMRFLYSKPNDNLVGDAKIERAERIVLCLVQHC